MKQNKAVLWVAAAVVVVVAAAIIALGNKHKTPMPMPASQSSSQADASQAVATKAVDIKGYAFSPMTIKVKVGDTVTWTNQDDVHHDVVDDDSSAGGPHGPLIGKGQTYSFTFTKAGTYNYHCEPHPYMHGVVVVTQ